MHAPRDEQTHLDIVLSMQSEGMQTRNPELGGKGQGWTAFGPRALDVITRACKQGILSLGAGGESFTKTCALRCVRRGVSKQEILISGQDTCTTMRAPRDGPFRYYIRGVSNRGTWKGLKGLDFELPVGLERDVVIAKAIECHVVAASRCELRVDNDVICQVRLPSTRNKREEQNSPERSERWMQRNSATTHGTQIIQPLPIRATILAHQGRASMPLPDKKY